jgi:hypothetical protein
MPHQLQTRLHVVIGIITRQDVSPPILTIPHFGRPSPPAIPSRRLPNPPTRLVKVLSIPPHTTVAAGRVVVVVVVVVVMST